MIVVRFEIVHVVDDDADPFGRQLLGDKRAIGLQRLFVQRPRHHVVVEKEELSALCESMGIAYAGCNRLSVSDAFRSATGDLRERVPVTTDGETNIYLAYCRDNKHTAGILSRELVKETLNRHTNQYEKLANISYDKADGIFRCDNTVYDDAVDVPECCRRAEELFELYQKITSIFPLLSADNLASASTCTKVNTASILSEIAFISATLKPAGTPSAAT